MIRELRRACPGETFTYNFLMDHLREYADPRGKIGRMLAAKEIVRVKKGLYVFGPDYRNDPIDRSLLANLIYGPSYVSGLYVLSRVGLIPERVETVTSMTTGRNKQFTTPFGPFEYLYLNPRRYSVGIDWVEVNERERVLSASPEKALADLVAKERDLKRVEEMRELLVEDLRIDEERLCGLDQQRMAKIAIAYRNRSVSLLRGCLQSYE